MIHYVLGNILESEASALVNTVNLVGVMGKGVALQFKNRYPANYKIYKKACTEQTIGIGKLLVTHEEDIMGSKIIINFPTKTDWRKPSEYSYIEAGLEDLIKVIDTYNIKSIAIPPLGAGNGGLNWEKVKTLIENRLSSLDIDIFLYQPNAAIAEQLKAERVKLTEGRALLLYVLFDLVRHGEYVSEFSSEKVCYFLQKFGAERFFKLHYEPKYYGPYSGKVRYVLNALNGSYIMGYSNMDKKPFDSLSLVADGYEEVKEIVNNDDRLNEIATKTTAFLSGFYSDFGLELLSSIDYIMTQHGTLSSEEIHHHLSEWSSRKEQLFSDLSYIDIAKTHLLKTFSYN